MPISFGLTSNLSIDQNLSVGGTAAITSTLTLSSTTASSLLYSNASKVASSVTLASNLSLTTGTLALATALTSINSVTAASGTALTLSGGSSGASLVLGSGASGPITLTPTGATSVVVAKTATSASETNASLALGTTSTRLLAGVETTTNTAYLQGVNPGVSFSRALVLQPLGANVLIGTTTDISGSGNLAVAGGTVTAGAAATNLTLSGGSSGASLALGSGGNGAVTITPKGTGYVSSPNGYFHSTLTALSGGYGLNASGGSYLGIQSAMISPSKSAIALGYTGTAMGAITPIAYFVESGNVLIGTTTDMSGVAGGVKIAATNASTGVGFGALQVAGGIYAGAASYFGGNLNAAQGNFSDYVTVARTGSAKVVLTNNTASKTWEMNAFSDSKFYITESGVNNWFSIANTTGAATFAGAVSITSASGMTSAGNLTLTTATDSRINFIAGQTAWLNYNLAADRWTFRHTTTGAASLTLTEAASTFAGAVTAQGLFYPQQATTAGAPAYVKGAIYFDTTLNKLRVGGASAWETITSV